MSLSLTIEASPGFCALNAKKLLSHPFSCIEFIRFFAVITEYPGKHIGKIVFLS
jgi:hypothetical protein